jgi:hypothetical protein
MARIRGLSTIEARDGGGLSITLAWRGRRRVLMIYAVALGCVGY